jgi:hypothetical protein
MKTKLAVQMGKTRAKSPREVCNKAGKEPCYFFVVACHSAGVFA